MKTLYKKEATILPWSKPGLLKRDQMSNFHRLQNLELQYRGLLESATFCHKRPGQ